MRILQKVHDLTRREAVSASFFSTVSFNLNALDPEMFKLCYSKEDHILSIQILLSSMDEFIETLKVDLLKKEFRLWKQKSDRARLGEIGSTV